MYIVYEEHIEQLEKENEELEKKFLFYVEDLSPRLPEMIAIPPLSDLLFILERLLSCINS